MLFMVQVKESYDALTTYLIGLDSKDKANDPGAVKDAIKKGTTYQTKVDGEPIIHEIIGIEPHKDEEQELRDRLKVIRDFKRKSAELNKKTTPAPTPAPAPTKATKKTK